MTRQLQLQISANILIYIGLQLAQYIGARVYQVSVKLRSTQRSLSRVIYLWLSLSGSASEAADVCKVPNL